MKIKSNKAVMIHWVDSTSAYGWKDINSTEDFDMGVHTMGWLIQDLPDSYVISAHVSDDGTQVDSPMRIPKVSVTGFWEMNLCKP